MTPDELRGPVSDLLEEHGFEDVARFLKGVPERSERTWGIKTKGGRLVNVAAGLRREAILDLVDSRRELPPEEQKRIWNLYRRKYGVRVVRICLVEEPA